MSATLEFGTHDFDGGRVVAPRGEIDAATCEQLAERLTAPPGSLLVVDLAHVTFMDSSGLGTLQVARRHAVSGGGEFVVTRPTPFVMRVLEITGLDIWVYEWDPRWDPRVKDTPVESARHQTTAAHRLDELDPCGVSRTPPTSVGAGRRSGAATPPPSAPCRNH